MKPTAILKNCVDAAMYLLFLLLIGQYLLRDAVHEWLGLTAGALFVLHNALNYRWYKALFRGKYNATRAVQTIVNVLLLIAVFGCILSGILASQYIFVVGSGAAIEFGRFLHLITTAWAFILMSIHLGLHGAKFIGKADSAERDGGAYAARKLSRDHDRAMRIRRVSVRRKAILGRTVSHD